MKRITKIISHLIRQICEYIPVSFRFPQPIAVQRVPTGILSDDFGRQIGLTWSLKRIGSFSRIRAISLFTTFLSYSG